MARGAHRASTVTRIETIDDEASVGVLVERAIGGARELATHEAALVLVELERDGRALQRTLAIALAGVTCLSVAIAWAGVALAMAVPLGAGGIALLAALFAVLGVVVLLGARRQLPPTILGESRVRLERRIAHVTESLR